MANIEPIHPEGMSTPFGHWTTAMAVDGAKRMIFISGCTARGDDGKIAPEGDMGRQTHQVCKNIKKAVETAGGTMADIVNVTVWATDVTKFDEIHAARREYWPQNPPASAMVEVPRLVDSMAMIEIAAIAVI